MLLEEFIKKFNYVEQVSTLAIATILDPRFKRIHFNDKVACSHAVNKITNAVNVTAISNLTAETPKNIEVPKTDFWSHHQNLVTLSKTREMNNYNPNEMPEDLRYYLNQAPIKIDDSPMQFWNRTDSLLSKLAKKYLAVIATSVPSERLFSKAGKIMTEARNRLSGEHLQYLLFLGSLSSEDWNFNQNV